MRPHVDFTEQRLDPLRYGKLAFDAHREGLIDNRRLPSWENLPWEIQALWIRAAQAVLLEHNRVVRYNPRRRR